MTYRNDHEAALARVEVLEQEVARLQADQSRQGSAEIAVSKRPGVRSRWRLVAIAGALVIAGIVVGITLAVPMTPASTPPIVPERSMIGTDFQACAAAIKPCVDLDAERTDPRGKSPANVASIRDTLASCRGDLDSYFARSNAERVAVERWLAREAELAGAVSRILVYYGSDPYRLDRYASANQLWLEYKRACSARNSELRRWRNLGST